MDKITCRFCKSDKLEKFIDLGYAPPSNDYLSFFDLSKGEVNLPLRVSFCKDCWLVQTEDYAAADEIFRSDYAYLSSTSKSWCEHAKNYVEKISNKLNLNERSFVVEIASNDGYLLENFLLKKVPCLGIEPTKIAAEIAIEKGINVEQVFFGEETAKIIAKTRKADLIIGNNVFAHVPNINDFTKGLTTLLSAEGSITLEFPHLLNLMLLNQFDTIYHEHFSYFSLIAVNKILKKHSLRLYDVEELSTHGGSLRIYVCHQGSSIPTNMKNIQNVLLKEQEFGLDSDIAYKLFQDRVDNIKNSLLTFLINAKHENKLVLGFGAAAKGNTFLNYAGIKSDLLPFICDNASSKQDKYCPGNHIPIVKVSKIKELKPNYILILPWNLSSEIESELSFARDFNCKFVTAIPNLKIF